MEFTTQGKGVTTNSYTDNTLSFSVARRYFKSFSIINTDSSNDLKFKFTGYFHKSEVGYKTLKGETTLESGEKPYNLQLSDVGLHHIKLEVKNDTADTPATWAYEVFLN